MSRNLSISETGLRLIKAFEGYRPVDRELVTGARVIGYGHRVYDAAPPVMNREDAEDLLKLDLAAYEELINEEVHAPLNQSQFDALCSLAFNIGPKAFRASDTLRALNNGRILDAANGFDVWRKATIDGKTYVVDALMRRRTAEKSLFLRTERSVPATTALLEPKPDEVAALVPTDDGLPVFTSDDSAGIVAKVPYESTPNPMRRREDQELGILTLSEVVEGSDADSLDFETPDANLAEETAETALLKEDEAETAPKDSVDSVETVETTSPLSVVREAADALGDRLDALIDGDDDAPTAGDWPQSLIQPADPKAEPSDNVADEDGPDRPANLLSFPTPVRKASEDTSLTDSVRVEETEAAETEVSDAEAREEIPPLAKDLADLSKNATADADANLHSNDSGWRADQYSEEDAAPAAGLWIPLLLGFALLGASLMGLWLGAKELLGEWGPIMAVSGTIIGALMIVFSLYLITADRIRDV